jgi:hypothetical protein
LRVDWLGVLSAVAVGVYPQKLVVVCNIALEQFPNLETANSEKSGEENSNSDLKELEVCDGFIQALSCWCLIDCLLITSC